MYERLGFCFLREWKLEDNPDAVIFYCMARAPGSEHLPEADLGASLS